MLKSLLQRCLAPVERKLIFYPVAPSHLAYVRFEPCAITLTVGAATLQGWHIENTHNPQSALLYFGGNAEDVVHSLDFLASLPVRHVLAFNYRGYGLSTGQPDEASLFSDALVLYQHLQTRLELPAHRIHVIGRSLGSAVATHLAAHHSLATVTLITPLQSVETIASELFSWLPVSQLMTNRFQLLDNAQRIDTPLLAILAGQDEVIPNAHSLALFEAWKGPKQQLLLPLADHNNVTGFAECYETMTRFLQAHGNAADRV